MVFIDINLSLPPEFQAVFQNSAKIFRWRGFSSRGTKLGASAANNFLQFSASLSGASHDCRHERNDFKAR